MIAAFKPLQSRAGTERLAKWFKQSQIGKFVARTLQEQYRHLNIAQMRTALAGGFSR